MNLTPEWAEYLRTAGFNAIHWSKVGSIDAPDHEIMQWARSNSWIVLTNDLDFGTMLATSGADAPSVVQLRTNNTLPSRVGQVVVRARRAAEADLRTGALLTIEGDSARSRSLPFDQV